MKEIPKSPELFSSNPIIEDIVSRLEETLTSVEDRYSMPRGFLRVELAVHIPRFSMNELYLISDTTISDMVSLAIKEPFEVFKLKDVLGRLPLNVNLIKNEIERLATRFRHVSGFYQEMASCLPSYKMRIECKRDKIFLVPLGEGEAEWIEVEFREVEDKIGLRIQEELHYIHQPRYDTLLHLGLFRKGVELPFSYVAFSLLDREYIAKLLPLHVSKNETFVLTRLYSVNNAPSNTTSTLIGCALDFVKNKYKGMKMVVSALNQNIFRGSSFRASNFVPIGLSPMRPLYVDGNFTTRRGVVERLGTANRGKLRSNPRYSEVKIPYLPILWLGRGLRKGINSTLNKKRSIPLITEEEYERG